MCFLSTCKALESLVWMIQIDWFVAHCPCMTGPHMTEFHSVSSRYRGVCVCTHTHCIYLSHKNFVADRRLIDFLSWTLLWAPWFNFHNQNTENKDSKLWKSISQSHVFGDHQNKKRILSCVLKRARIKPNRIIDPTHSPLYGGQWTNFRFCFMGEKTNCISFSKAESPCENHWQGPTETVFADLRMVGLF